jgi:hypothetical protein
VLTARDILDDDDQNPEDSDNTIRSYNNSYITEHPDAETSIDLISQMVHEQQQQVETTIDDIIKIRGMNLWLYTDKEAAMIAAIKVKMPYAINLACCVHLQENVKDKTSKVYKRAQDSNGRKKSNSLLNK